MKEENYKCPHCGKYINKIGPHKCRDCGILLSPQNRSRSNDGNLCRSCKNRRQRQYYMAHRRRLEKALGKECVLCGGPKQLYHHTIPISKHGNRSKYERDAKSGVLWPLCNSCHQKWHEMKEELGLGIM